MTTLKGFLSQKDGEPPRLTEKQRWSVYIAVEKVLEHHLSEVVASSVCDIVHDALYKMNPASTACPCCDFYRDGHCAKWDHSIPDDVVDKGCNAFQDTGAPF